MVNHLIKGGHEHSCPPLAVLPWGTSNDFADQLAGGVLIVERLFRAISRGKTLSVDVGCLNGSYFINVAGCGLMVDVAHKTKDTLKQKLGMLAYYLEGARSFPNYKPFTLHLEKEGIKEEVEVYLFLVLNSKGAGGFYHLAPKASFCDGKLDVLLLKNTGFHALITLLPRLLKGLHGADSRIIYFQAESFKVEGPPELEIDLDGEPGPAFPLFFQTLPRKLKFITPLNKKTLP